jgi:hypothetical protein
MIDPSTNTFPPVRTPEAQRMYEVFKMQYQGRLQTVRPPLNILIWGPGTSSSSRVRKKRVQIHDELTRLGHNPMFSEDLDGLGDDMPANLKELVQGELVHMIIDLMEDSPGALAEVHDFATYPNVGWKLHILIPQAYKDGYSAKGIIRIVDELFSCVYWYADGEIESCNVLTQVLKRVVLMQEYVASRYRPVT